MIKQKYKTCHIASLVLKKMASFSNSMYFSKKYFTKIKTSCENHVKTIFIAIS